MMQVGAHDWDRSPCALEYLTDCVGVVTQAWRKSRHYFCVKQRRSDLQRQPGFLLE